MAERSPWFIDESGPAPVLTEFPAADTVPASNLPLATTSVRGAIAPADRTALDNLASTIATAVGAEATTRAAADTALDGRLDTVEATVAALDPLGEQNEASNLTTAAPNTPAEEFGLFKQRNAGSGALELRAVHVGAGLEASLVGDSIRVARRPSIWTPPTSLSRRGLGYRDVRRQGVRTAGAQGDTTGLADNHGSDHLYPYMLWAGLDVNGFPHNRHKRLESSNAGNDSGELGYEFGHDVEAGDFRDGRGLIFHGRGFAQNVGFADAFWDWVVEINPTVGDFAGANRLRMVSPEFDDVWAGTYLFDYRVELRSEGLASYSVVGTWRIFNPNGTVRRTWTIGLGTTTGFDFLAAAARIQLRWRVDRALATRLDTFDNTNQGDNQGANLLRCSVRTYALDWDGFPKD